MVFAFHKALEFNDQTDQPTLVCFITKFNSKLIKNIFYRK